MEKFYDYFKRQEGLMVEDWHKKICDAMEDESIKALVIMMPPRHGKTEISGIRYPRYLKKYYPDKKIGYFTFYNRLSEVNAEKADNSNMDAQVIFGSTYGKMYDIIIIDDPIKDVRDACNDEHIAKLKEYINCSVRTRISPEGRIIIIMNRWNEFNPVDLLDVEEAKVIKLKCIQSNGMAMWEKRFGGRYYEEIKELTGDKYFKYLYQQGS